MNSSEIIQTAFIINQKVIAEIVNGEAIIVNLESGNYYSLRGSACFLWQKLIAAHSLAQLAEFIRMHYLYVPETCEAELRTFILELQDEGLVVAKNELPVPLELGHQLTEKAEYSRPVMEKFTDMADLLLLDPIHEVDEEAGWPFNKKSDAP